MKLEGCYTALVTPFNNMNVDWDSLEKLIEEQVLGNVAGIVPMGTTGESPTLKFEEHSKVIKRSVEIVNGRCQVIAGTGANSTEEAVMLTKIAKKNGADASLQVTPYYNKPTQKGLFKHFSTVAKEGGLPIILYNVPGRSGVPISLSTVVELSKIPQIIAVKEAAGSVDRVSEILNACDITVLSGDDALTIPMMSLGAKGVISVASNIIPSEVSELVKLALNEDFLAARMLHYKLYSFFSNLFIETNPIPIKTALAMQGKMKEEFRLPLCEMSTENKLILKEDMRKLGLL